MLRRHRLIDLYAKSSALRVSVMKIESQHTHDFKFLGRWIEYIVWPDVLCHMFVNI